jgi:hypothetical protein
VAETWRQLRRAFRTMLSVTAGTSDDADCALSSFLRTLVLDYGPARIRANEEPRKQEWIQTAPHALDELVCDIRSTHVIDVVR